jgi:hypothetical protein
MILFIFHVAEILTLVSPGNRPAASLKCPEGVATSHFSASLSGLVMFFAPVR